VSVSLLVALCGFALLAIFLGPRLVGYEILRSMRHGQPQLAMVPQPLKDTTASSAEGMAFSRFGYEFEIPWKDLSKINDYKTAASIFFKSGRVVMFMDPKQQIDRIKIMNEEAAKKGRDLQAVFGSEIVASNYQFVKAALSMTPNQVSMFKPGNEAARDLILLGNKGTEIVNAESGLYSVEANGFRGFQKGDPSRGEGRTLLELFDDQDHELVLMISTGNRTTAPVTQADVNCILQTLHPSIEVH